MSFDLASIDALTRNLDEGTEVEIKHPVTNEPIGLTIRVAGYESDRAKAYTRKAYNEALRDIRHTPTAEERDQNVMRFQVAMTLGWTWADGLTLDGKVPEFSPPNVERVLKRFPWISSATGSGCERPRAFFVRLTEQLCRAVRLETELRAADDNGVTRRQALLEVEGWVDDPFVPAVVGHVYAWFWELDAFRATDMGRPLGIPASEVEAWSRSTGQVVTPWECAALFAMDRARRDALLEPIQQLQPSITPEMFDAVLG